jgi:putative membrane protein
MPGRHRRTPRHGNCPVCSRSSRHRVCTLLPRSSDAAAEAEPARAAASYLNMNSSQPASVHRSIHKALLAGLAGGLIGSAAKIIAEALVPPRTEGQIAPPQLAVAHAAAAASIPVDAPTVEAAAKGLHWGFGTLTGGLYGLAAEYYKPATAWKGAAFGLALNRLTHEGLLPKAGLAAPVAEQTSQERLSEWVTHLVYGVVTETVRSAVRKRL